MDKKHDKKNVISLVIDGQQAGSLGVYGNTWLDTPAWNRLACNSLVCDFAFSGYHCLSTAYDAYWFARDAIYSHNNACLPECLPALFKGNGYRCVLLTDEPEIAKHSAADGFDHIEILPQTTPNTLAESIEQTHFAQIIATAGEMLQMMDSSTFLWIHSRGLYGPWDAPYSFREQFVEEEDPQPDESPLVPSLILPEDHDDDELLLHRFRYAGQVACIDQCMDLFLNLFQQSDRATDTLLSVTSPRGFPLGEHRQIGDIKASLHEEQIHVPWLLSMPDGDSQFARCDQFVLPADLPYTILDWVGLVSQQAEQIHPNLAAASMLPLVDSKATTWRDRIYLQTDPALQAIRTYAWHCIIEADQAKLYLKPDDRWEVNDLAARCQEITLQLAQTMQSDLKAIAAGDLASMVKLEQQLLLGLE